MFRKGVLVNGNAQKVKKIAKENGIDLTVKVKKVQEGWEGKAKGRLQVLYERGFIDPQK